MGWHSALAALLLLHRAAAWYGRGPDTRTRGVSRRRLAQPLKASDSSRGPSPIADALARLEAEAELPIFEVLAETCASLRDRPNLLLEAPPGAGKTSVVPLALLGDVAAASSSSSSGERNIIVVEPRRVSVRAAAARMASILDEPVGARVGYAVRGDARTSRDTRVTVMTDGVLLNRVRVLFFVWMILVEATSSLDASARAASRQKESGWHGVVGRIPQY